MQASLAEPPTKHQKGGASHLNSMQSSEFEAEDTIRVECKRAAPNESSCSTMLHATGNTMRDSNAEHQARPEANSTKRRRGQSPRRASADKSPCEDEDTTKNKDEESNDDWKYASKFAVGSTLGPLTHLSTHVKLRGAFNGERYGFPGVGDASTEFAVPTAASEIQEIVGQYLVALDKTLEGGLAVQRRKSSERDTNKEKVSIVLSPAPVCHLLDSNGNVRTHGNLGDLADEHNFVQVCFHHTQSYEECFDIPCANTDDISTPATPPPSSPSQ